MNITNHGDHYTAGRVVNGTYIGVVVQPQQKADGGTAYYANAWRDGLLVASSHYEATPEAAARLVLFAASQVRRCPECLRLFDLLNADDANEWSAGHDCEA